MAEATDIEAILAACLEAIEGGAEVEEVLRRYPEHEAELKPLLEAAAWMVSQRGVVEPRAGFVEASRARLLERIAAKGVVEKRNRLAEIWDGLKASLGGGRRYALQVALAVLVMACLVVGSFGAALASQEALPGELLYPVKLGLEQVELLVTLDMAGDIHLHTQFAQLRLIEMEKLLALGRYDDLGLAAANYRYHLDRALALLRLLAAQDPTLARQQALELVGTLWGQADRLAVLSGIPPANVAGELEDSEQAARQAARQAEEIGQQPGSTLPMATNTPTAPTGELKPLPSATQFVISPTPTPTGSVQPVLAFSPTPSAAYTITPTSAPIKSATPTPSAPAKPSATPTTKATLTPKPSATGTLKPTATFTSAPTVTGTALPTPTSTGQPTATPTSQPTATPTGQPTEVPTNTPAPPTPTITIAPPPTRTPKPTPTPLPPTNTPVPTPYPGPPVYPPP